MNLQQQLGEWYPLLSHVFDTEWMQKLGRRLSVAENVVPAPENWFRAFKLCPPSKLKVVIIGQDPYINGEADGLAFSSYGKMTPSLEVVFEEINRTGWTRRTQTHLDDWAVQGVLLLNSVLTTRLGKSKAHAGWRWENFVSEVMLQLIMMKWPIVYMLWGKDAQSLQIEISKKTRAVLDSGDKLLLKAHHPQAQNYNPANKFVGCNHFNEANLFLLRRGIKPIWWTNPLPEDDLEKKHEWWVGYLQHLKMISHAEVNILEILHSYPTVPDQPHPFDRGLERGYHDTLPF